MTTGVGGAEPEQRPAPGGVDVHVVAADEGERTLSMVRVLVDRAHLATAGQVPDVVAEAARALGWTAQLFLIDYEQRQLVAAPVSGLPPRRPQAVETTVAGRCFRTVQPVPSASSGTTGVWLPVLDGVDRLGVLEVRLPAGTGLEEETTSERCRLLGHLTGHLVAAKSPYGHGLDAVRRRRPRTVASDLLHALLPPLTFGCEGLVVSGLLQPAYDVAADAFDYDVAAETAHLAVLDATGHDLAGTLLATVALTGHRNGRWQGHGLYDCARAMDELIAEHGHSERFATGVLAELDLPSGRLRYLNAGHPAPLLMRDGKVVKELTGGRRLLFGLGDGQVTIAEEWLQPGDRIVCYTDGVTEARGREGEFFGLPRLVDHLQNAAAAGLPAPETLRRISHAVLDHQGGVLQDDATLLIAEWGTGDEHTLLSTGSGTGSAQRPGGVASEDLSPSHGDRHDAPRR